MSNFTKRELKKLRRSLPKGWASELASKFEISTGSVENILYGTHKNDDVIIAAVEMAEAFKNLMESKTEQAKEAISKL